MVKKVTQMLDQPVDNSESPIVGTVKIRHFSQQVRVSVGMAARDKTPCSIQAAWDPPADRSDPVALLEEQGKNRLGVCWLRYHAECRQCQSSAGPGVACQSHAGCRRLQCPSRDCSGTDQCSQRARECLHELWHDTYWDHHGRHRG